MPEDDALIAHLVTRAAAHFPRQATIAQDVFVAAAELLARDRRIAQKANVMPLPGQAEYLDLLRAVFRLAPEDVELQKKRLEAVARFAIRKYEQVVP